MSKHKGKGGGGIAPYGSGVSQTQPFFPTEEMFGTKGDKGILSPHKTIFRSLPFNDTNAFDHLPHAGKGTKG